MIDAAVRQRLGPSLDRAGAALAARGARAGWLTGAGWAAGVGACTAAGTRAWGAALGLWLLNRALDGLDGPVARARSGATDHGAFLDIVADFSIYGGFVVAVGIAEPNARWACLGLLLTYYVSGTAFLALSSLLERRRSEHGDERSLRFVGGLAEGAETVLVYVLFCLFPGQASLIAALFAGAVAVTAVQRVRLGAKLLAAARPERPPWNAVPAPTGSHAHEGADAKGLRVPVLTRGPEVSTPIWPEPVPVHAARRPQERLGSREGPTDGQVHSR